MTDAYCAAPPDVGYWKEDVAGLLQNSHSQFSPLTLLKVRELASPFTVPVQHENKKSTGVWHFNCFCLDHDFGIIGWPCILRNFQDLILVLSFSPTVCWPRCGSPFSV